MAKRQVQKETRSQPHFLQFNNLACETAGGKVIFATDEWFAPARNLLKRDPPEFIASAFTEFGKWMDGWETRRKRIPGHDWCIVQLGVPGIIHGFDVDTSFFTGNYAPFASIQATCLDQMPSIALEGDRTGMAASPSQFEAVAQLNSDSWKEVVPVTKLKAGYSDTCHNYLSVSYPHRVTHIRFNIYPGLGMAENMGDGWETARRLDRPRVLKEDENGILQVPGSEWAIFRLGHPGIISKIELDTNHFKGNFPDSCRIEACSLTEDEENSFIQSQWSSDRSPMWNILLPPQKMKAHHRHVFSGPSLVHCGPVSHVRMVIAPDGGISRLRIWGRPVSSHQMISKL
ncbi:allantoicase isoform X1 [Danio rerio]|uniref:Allantoate amidinohydrolase n=1 Tax=Danio rerio TaxID=7955 RepID=A0AB32T9D2_DANRE